jgi:hypothetical protein
VDVRRQMVNTTLRMDFEFLSIRLTHSTAFDTNEI